MLQTLKDEEADDIKQRDWCIEERDTYRNDRDDKSYDISQLEAKIEKAELKKKKLETHKSETEDAKEQLLDDMAQALSDRQAENQNFYGANNAFVQKQPVFDVSEDQAPDATFSDSGKHSGAKDGIVALLTQIKENLENEIGLATRSEAKATEEYDALKANADAQDAAYAQQITDLESAIADTDAEIEEDTNTKGDTEEEKQGMVDYLASIKANCDWIEGAFTKCAEARKKESEGLAQAKAILAGSEGGDYGFLQRSH